VPDRLPAARVEIGDYELVLERGAPTEVYAGRQPTRGIVRALLSRHLGNPMILARLRRAAADLDPLAAQMDDAQTLALVALQVELGRWQLRPRAEEALVMESPTAITLSGLAAPPTYVPFARDNHYIDIELVDDEAQAPVAGERFCLELPGGQVLEGTLDGEGFARVVGIEDRGTCRVSFPDLEVETWRTGVTAGEAASAWSPGHALDVRHRFVVRDDWDIVKVEAQGQDPAPVAETAATGEEDEDDWDVIRVQIG
jgi:hypothetical protein